MNFRFWVEKKHEIRRIVFQTNEFKTEPKRIKTLIRYSMLCSTLISYQIGSDQREFSMRYCLSLTSDASLITPSGLLFHLLFQLHTTVHLCLHEFLEWKRPNLERLPRCSMSSEKPALTGRLKVFDKSWQRFFSLHPTFHFQKLPEHSSKAWKLRITNFVPCWAKNGTHYKRPFR